MEWKGLKGKEIFLKLRDGSCYTGKIIEVDEKSPPLIFLTLIDKYGKEVTIVHSEIIKLVEEESGNGVEEDGT